MNEYKDEPKITWFEAAAFAFVIACVVFSEAIVDFFAGLI